MTKERKEELFIAAIAAALIVYLLFLARRSAPSVSYPPMLTTPTLPTINGGTVDVAPGGGITLDTTGIPTFQLPSSGGCDCGGSCGSSAGAIPSLDTIVQMTNAGLDAIYQDGSASLDEIARIGSNDWINYQITTDG